ncbi:hypothetical protein BDW22DRAFT_385320 [Trametopsis cervina]|nr:hypothetical protein BDW22DRAFT_385320 [Trametopsis cervina]
MSRECEARRDGWREFGGGSHDELCEPIVRIRSPTVASEFGLASACCSRTRGVRDVTITVVWQSVTWSPGRQSRPNKVRGDRATLPNQWLESLPASQCGSYKDRSAQSKRVHRLLASLCCHVCLNVSASPPLYHLAVLSLVRPDSLISRPAFLYRKNG